MICDKTTYCGCLYYSANALARIMTKMAEEEFANTGLAPSYAFLLMTVNSNEGIQPKEISKIMQLTPSTVTRLIEKMEHKGLLLRQSAGKNTEVYPTQLSKELDIRIKESWSNLYKRYSELIGEEEGKELTKNINLAIDKLD